MDKTATLGRTFYYKVCACARTGYQTVNGPFSTQVSGVIPLATPVVTATVYSSGASLSWPVVAGATSYRIYRAGSDGVNYVLLGTRAATAFFDGTVQAGVTYFYKVQAVYTASGQSEVISPMSARVPVTMPRPTR